jgi:multidrug efflux pump subunit AcrB
MRSLVSWFVHNPVAANMLMILILFAGLLSAFNIRVEGFPKIPADTIEVNVVQVGASAQQMHQSVTTSIEQALEGVPGAKQISSISSDSVTTVYIKKEYTADLDQVLEEVRARINNITSLPDQAERPEVRQALFNYPALIVQVFGNVDQQELQKVARIIRQRLLATPEISQVSQWGERAKEMSIELKPQTLRAYNLTLDEVAQLIASASIEYRTGQLKVNGTRIQVRADAQARQLRDFMELPLFTDENGGVVRLSNIATVRDTFSDEDVHVTFQGQSAIGFEIKIAKDGDLFKVNEAVQKVLSDAEDILSHQIKADVWANQSQFASERLSMLQSNAWQGLALVFLMLSLFLHVRIAFWVAVSIPVCVAGTLAVMENYLGYSLNDITTFGMIIVLGLLVDDGVVIGESIHEKRSVMDDGKLAAIAGTEQVATATVFGALTTIAAFFPMTMLDDPFGQVFGSFAVVVVAALLFSVIESKLILPAHLASATLKSKSNNWFSRFSSLSQSFLNQQLEKFSERVLQPILSLSIEHRWAVLIIFVGVFWFFTQLMSLGIIRTTFFPNIPSNIITIKMETDARLSHQITLGNAQEIVEAGKALNRQWQEEMQLAAPPIEKIMMAVQGTSNAEVYAELSGPDNRPMTSMQILNAWRERSQKLEGINKLSFSASEEAASGFEIILYSRDSADLQQAVDTARSILTSFSGVLDTSTDLQAGTPEVRLRINQNGIALGLTAEQLAQQVGNAFGGIEIQRFQRGVDELKVFLRYPEAERASQADLLGSEIRLNDGSWVPLASVADVETHYVPQWIWRRDFNDAATVFANIDKSITSSPEVYSALVTNMAAWLKGHPGITLKAAGELEEEEALSSRLWKAFFLACLLIYVLMAIPLKSYRQPLVILSIIPFGFVGAAAGHLIMDLPFSALSFFGMLALCGVVVNDSLMLVTRYNQLVRDGESDAIYAAASSRLRAVFLTTVTHLATDTVTCFRFNGRKGVVRHDSPHWL